MKKENHSLHVVQSIASLWIKNLLYCSNRSPVEVPLWISIRGADPSATVEIQRDHSLLQISLPLQSCWHLAIRLVVFLTFRYALKICRVENPLDMVNEYAIPLRGIAIH